MTNMPLKLPIRDPVWPSHAMSCATKSHPDSPFKMQDEMPTLVRLPAQAPLDPTSITSTLKSTRASLGHLTFLHIKNVSCFLGFYNIYISNKSYIYIIIYIIIYIYIYLLSFQLFSCNLSPAGRCLIGLSMVDSCPRHYWIAPGLDHLDPRYDGCPEWSWASQRAMATRKS